MDVRFGVHTGLQHTNTSELRELWSRIETLGFDWISIWDHFYAADATGDPHCLEAITAHTALAMSTTRVTCGSLVYSAGYRHPAVLANAIATMDQLAEGRIVLCDRFTDSTLVYQGCGRGLGADHELGVECPIREQRRDPQHRPAVGLAEPAEPDDRDADAAPGAAGHRRRCAGLGGRAH